MGALMFCLRIIGLLTLWTVKAELHEKLTNPFSDKFLKLPASIARQTTLQSCWLCTYSPVYFQSMPYIAASLDVSEIVELAQEPLLSTFADHLEGAKSFPLKVAGWVKMPWFIFNRTDDSKAGLHEKAQLSSEQHGYVMRCFPNYSNCECLHIKKPEKVEHEFPLLFDSLNSTDCYGNSTVSTFCVGINVPGKTWCAQQVQSWLLFNMVNALAGKITAAQEKIIKATSLDIQVAKFLVKVFSQSGNTLPPNVYFVCGTNAYKWLPHQYSGICTLARLSFGK